MCKRFLASPGQREIREKKMRAKTKIIRRVHMNVMARDVASWQLAYGMNRSAVNDIIMILLLQCSNVECQSFCKYTIHRGVILTDILLAFLRIL